MRRREVSLRVRLLDREVFDGLVPDLSLVLEQEPRKPLNKVFLTVRQLWRIHFRLYRAGGSGIERTGWFLLVFFVFLHCFKFDFSVDLDPQLLDAEGTNMLSD